MNLGLRNKRVLVTGGSRGIGLEIAKHFLQEGAKVIISSRGQERLTKVENELVEEYGKENILTYICDFTKIKTVSGLAEYVEHQWSGVDIVVANIGNGRSVPDALPDDELWQKTWNNNFESALQTARIFLPMLKKSNGCLLFISSIAGMEAFGAPTDYSTAKSAIIALSKNMARKLAPNVRVNVVAPGNVYFKGGSWDEEIKHNKKRVDEIIRKTVPMNRFALPQEIADSVVFLCSDRASFVTGVTLVVDGGQTVGVF